MLSKLLNEYNITEEKYNIKLNSSKTKKFIKDLTEAIHDVRELIKNNKIKYKRDNATKSLKIKVGRYYDSKISKILNDYTGHNAIFVIENLDVYVAYYSPNVGDDNIVNHLSTKLETLGRGDLLMDHRQAIARIKELNELSHSDDISQIDNKAKEELYNYFIGITNSFFINPEFTDKEIVALILHELGHGVSYITETTQEFHSSSIWNDIVEYASDDNRSFEELIELLDEMHDIKKEIENTKPQIITKDLQPIMLLMTILIGGGYTLLTKLKIGGNFFIPKLIVLTIIILLSNILLLRSYRHLINKRKYGDRLGDSYDIAFQERWADKYVAEHGMGYHLGSGLKKLRLVNFNNNILRHIVSGIEVIALTTQSIIFHRSIKNIIKNNNTFKMSYIPYDDLIARMELMKKNTYKLFKNKELSLSVKRNLTRQLKDMEKDIAEIKRIKHIKDTGKTKTLYARIIKGLINNKFAITPGGKIANDLEQLYFEMHGQTEDFIKNSFDYKQFQIDTRIKEL